MPTTSSPRGKVHLEALSLPLERDLFLRLLELGGARADVAAFLRHRRARSARRKVVAPATDGAET